MCFGESQIIDLLRTAGVRRDDIVVGIGDDAAVLAMPEGEELVLCTDTIVEGVHFPEGTSGFDIGWRALAVNLSDLAAMAARPRWATLALSLPEAEESWVREFARGFAELADEHEVALVGGDTVRGHRTVSVTLAGTVKNDLMLLRSGARAGHEVWVTGTLGDAAAGLRLFSGDEDAEAAALAHLYARFFRPQPLVDFGQDLGGVASAAIDVSDGLFSDAGRLAQASGVGLALEVERIPMSEAIEGTFDPETARSCAVAGGDDYELLFTLAPEQVTVMKTLAEQRNMSCTRIGKVVDGETVTYALEGKPWMPSHTGFEHFGTRVTE